MLRGRRNQSKTVEEHVHKHFHEWFKEYVARNDGADITPEIEWLANGPNNVVRRFKEYNVHGFKFRTMRKEQGLTTQNSGIVISVVTKRFSSGRESIEQSSDDMYYGKLVDIIELNYYDFTAEAATAAATSTGAAATAAGATATAADTAATTAGTAATAAQRWCSNV
ncbi:uncharacterized protein LOC132638633 [Lycium barbarum]|uniref:uncharacterized protein LOC132638633 n=1 Tax=Lycium barbarum TaxID=112863 RepID=UPI00293EADE8|nr:uncharacterized protein LOC132638633 [Lycium barbarum]XP_060211428.1 uncharacterized protein LOC132638633 [Lycium barbarum]